MRYAMVIGMRFAMAIGRRGRLVLAALAGVAAASPAAGADSIEQALRQSDFILDWRLRYETVDHDAFAATADAATSRLRAGFQTAPYRHTALLVEGVWVEDAIDDYDSTTNGHTQYPVVADPAGFTTVNRFALINESLPGARLTLGRQRIVLDDARFVGNVGFRQKEQTFDGLRAQLGAARWALDLSYASQVNRIFGPRSSAGKWTGSLVLANASRELGAAELTVFGYRFDLDQAPALSTNTLGVKLAGSKPLANLTGTYAAAYARQSDTGANAPGLAQRYYLVEGGLGRGRLGAALGYEVMTGDGERAFTTPLATLHTFQGWADVFLATPPAGLEDRYLRISYTSGRRGPFARIAMVAMYHDFRAHRGGARYGDELDLSLVARAERVALELKYARYSARELAADVAKLWLSLDFAL